MSTLGIILIALIFLALFGGFVGHRRWGAGGSIGIVGLLLIIVVVLLLTGHI